MLNPNPQSRGSGLAMQASERAALTLEVAVRQVMFVLFLDLDFILDFCICQAPSRGGEHAAVEDNPTPKATQAYLAVNQTRVSSRQSPALRLNRMVIGWSYKKCT